MTTKIPDDKAKAFLAELKAVCVKHGLVIAPESADDCATYWEILPVGAGPLEDNWLFECMGEVAWDSAEGSLTGYQVRVALEMAQHKAKAESARQALLATAAAESAHVEHEFVIGTKDFTDEARDDFNRYMDGRPLARKCGFAIGYQDYCNAKATGNWPAAK